MKKVRDLTGQKFGRLTAVLHNGNKWLCKCDCGNETLAKTGNLNNGHTQSCGCLQRERSALAATRHSLVGTRAYHSWAGMKARCSNPRNPAYKWYGARGIGYAPEWESFDGFYRDMGDCPPGMSIERRNNDASYSKGNCYWATTTQQANNTRATTFIEFGGERRSVTQWAKSLGWNQPKLQRRLRRGWSVEKALTTP